MIDIKDPKTTILKNTREGFNSSPNKSKETTSEFKDRTVEITQEEQHKTAGRKQNEKSADHLRDLKDGLKQTNIHIIGTPEKGERMRERSRHLFESIMAENFTNLGKKTDIHLYIFMHSTQEELNI